MLEAAAVKKLLAEAVFVGQGLEHRGVAPSGTSWVLKDDDPRQIDLETFEIFYKPAEHLFDYLTDHLLSNHFFGDDIRLYGFYFDRSHLHVLLSQPFIAGRHPNCEVDPVVGPVELGFKRWESCLERKGFRSL